MTLRISIFLFFIFSSQVVQSQNYQFEIVPYRSGDYRTEEKWGFADKDMNIVIPLIYDGTEPFIGGLAIVWSDGLAGAINIQGDTIIPIIHEELTAQDGVPLIIAEMSNQCGYYNYSGELVTSFEGGKARPFQEDLSLVQQGSKSGFIDTSGTVAIPFSECRYESFYDGMAQKAKLDTLSGQWTWGYINKEGQTVIPLQFKDARPFINGFAQVGESSSYMAFINKKGEQITPFIYRGNSGPFYEGIALVEEVHKEEYFIDTTGKKLNILPSFKEQTDSLSEEELMNKEIISLPVFSHYHKGVSSEGLIVFTEAKPHELFNTVAGGSYGFINQKGEVIISAKYDYASRFVNGLSAVVNDGQLMYIDKNDSIHLKTEFVWGAPFNCYDRAMVMIDEESYGFINRKGELLASSQMTGTVEWRRDHFGKNDFPINQECLDYFYMWDGKWAAGFVDIHGNKYFEQ